MHQVKFFHPERSLTTETSDSFAPLLRGRNDFPSNINEMRRGSFQIFTTERTRQFRLQQKNALFYQQEAHF